MANTIAKNILLVEDEAITALSGKRALEKYGYKVITANTGEKAVEIVDNSSDIDLILMDINLGRGIDGTESAAIILKNRDLPLIFMSSHTEREVVEKTEGITSYGYVVKNSGIIVLDAAIKMAFRLFEAKVKEQEKERALRENESFIYAILDNLPIGIAVNPIEASVNFTYMNEKFPEYYGTTKEALSDPESFWDAVYEDPVIRESIKKRVRDDYSSGVPERMLWTEVPIIRKGSETRFITAMNIPIPGKHLMVSTVWDVTERKRTWDALRTEELLFYTLIDALPDSIYFKDAQHRFLRVNKAKALEQDISSENIKGKTDFDFFPIAIAEQSRADDVEVFTTGNAIINKEEELGLQNKYTWVQTSKFPLRDVEGNIIGTMGISRDITKNKQDEKALKISEEKYSLAFRTSPYVITITRAENGRFIEVNNAFVVLTGFSQEEALSDSSISLDLWVKKEDRKYVLNELLNGRQVSGKEFLFRKKNGEVRSGLFSAVLIYVNDERCVLSSINDITERKQAEEKVNVLLMEKELLLKEVHHRIKNNMATIKSLLSLQANSIKDPTAITALHDSISRMQSMEVLYDKLYRAENLREMPIKDYLSSLVDEILGLFSNRDNVIIEKRLEDFQLGVNLLLPLGMIVNEILTNAMKYAFTGKVKGLLTVTSSMEDDHATITIVDDGIGMPESVDIKNSASFGLMLVGLLTDQIGGTIRIERKAGTKFILEFRVK